MSISSLCRNGTPSASSIAPLAAASTPRLLFVASTHSQGGIERHSAALAAALQGHGVPVWFACAPGGFVETWCRESDVRTDLFTVKNSGDLGAVLRLARLVCLHRIDVVHVHSRRDYVVAVLAVALARRVFEQRAALVLHAHMIRSLGGSSPLSARFFERGTDAVVAVSEAVSAHLLRRHPRCSKIIHVIPNGVDLAQFARPGSSEAARQRISARQELGISEDALVLGVIGRLDAKGQRQLLAVVPKLRTLCPNIFLVLVGSEGKPGEQTTLTAQAETGGFADRLVFTGPRMDIPALLPAFDVLVHLPTDEAFGLALAEAMAAGLPTVASAVGGCREVVQDGVTGILVAPHDPDALLAALASLLDPNRGAAVRAEMGAAGFARAQDLSQERQVEHLLALYQEICPALV